VAKSGNWKWFAIVDLSSDHHVSSSYLASLGWRHHLLVHTAQMVVTADVADNFKTASVKLAVSEIVADLGFALDERGLARWINRTHVIYLFHCYHNNFLWTGWWTRHCKTSAFDMQVLIINALQMVCMENRAFVYLAGLVIIIFLLIKHLYSAKNPWMQKRNTDGKTLLFITMRYYYCQQYVLA
jgi:hypothetical protein